MWDFNLVIPSLNALLPTLVAFLPVTVLLLQIRKQKKIDSVRFATEYIEKILLGERKTIRILNERINDDSKKFQDKYVEILLNRLDIIALSVTDNVINKKYVIHMLKITLRRLKKDKEVERIIKQACEQEPTAFNNIIKFWNKEID